MSKKDQEKLYEDESDEGSIEEKKDDAEKAILERLGISCEEFDKLFRARFMSNQMITWLQTDDKARQIVREIAAGVLKFYGVKTKKKLDSAKTDPIWIQVTKEDKKSGFRANPLLEGSSAQVKWLQKLFKEDEFTLEQYEAAAIHVSATWRRYRNEQKDIIFDAAFAYPWGTNESPLDKDERDVKQFFDSVEGSAQLVSWIVKHLMKVPPENRSCTHPEKPYQLWVKELIVDVRRKYANIDELNAVRKPQQKQKEGHKVAKQLLREGGFTSKKTDQDQEEELGSTEEHTNINRAKPQVGIRKRDIVHQIDDDDEDLPDPTKAKSSRKKSSAKNSDETDHPKQRQGKKKKDSSPEVPLRRSSKSNQQTLKKTPVEEPATPPTISKPRAKDNRPAQTTPVKRDDDDLDFKFSFDLPPSPINTSRTSTKKRPEKEKKNEEESKKGTKATEPSTTHRSTRSASKESNTNEKKRNALDASLSGSASPQKKKLKSSKTSP